MTAQNGRLPPRHGQLVDAERLEIPLVPLAASEFGYQLAHPNLYDRNRLVLATFALDSTTLALLGIGLSFEQLKPPSSKR